jgi:hypothetical protein
MVNGAGGNGLAKALLAQVKAQWYEFISWIDEFYKQLTEEANFKNCVARGREVRGRYIRRDGRGPGKSRPYQGPKAVGK